MSETPEIFEKIVSPEVRKDPYPFYSQLREESPVAEIMPGSWLVMRNADVVAVTESEQATTLREALGDSKSMPDDELEHFNDYRLLHTEGELHDKRRWFANESFKPRRIRALRPALEQDVAALVAEFQDEMTLSPRWPSRSPAQPCCESSGFHSKTNQTFVPGLGRSWQPMIRQASMTQK